MKAARLAGRTTKHPTPKIPAAPKIAAVHILAAKSDIAIGQWISPSDVTWRAWPANASNFIRRKQHSTAVQGLSGLIGNDCPQHDAANIVRFGVTTTTTPR